MTVLSQVITDKMALFNGDCVEVMRSLPEASVHLSMYSPPFGSTNGALYTYSNHPNDLSNCPSYATFMAHYEFVLQELTRITMPGRMTAVHCMDVPRSNSGRDSYTDFPGDIIRLHQKLGWEFAARHAVWKEPLAVRLRTMQKNLAHATLIEDSTLCGVAGADYILLFRRAGKNPIPVHHPVGLMEYAGAKAMPADILPYRGWKGKQTENKFSQWIWRQYASSIWDDIRMQHVLPYREARESEDEKHVHALQLDCIERIVTMRSNPGETVFTPFMGVGSEVYVPVVLGRRGVGAELKPSYFRQAVKNCEAGAAGRRFDVPNEALDFEQHEAETEAA